MEVFNIVINKLIYGFQSKLTEQDVKFSLKSDSNCCKMENVE